MTDSVNVLQFADRINRYDFIDNLIQYADPIKFEMAVCVRSEEHNIATPIFNETTKYKLLKGETRRNIPYTAWQLSKLLREWRIDILHTHHYDQALIGYIATQIHTKTKLIIGRHYSDSMYRLSGNIKPKIFLKIENLSNKAAKRIIVPSTFIKNLLVEKQDIFPDKIDIIPYGFSEKKFPEIYEKEVIEFRKEYNLEGKTVLCIIGRIDGQKGHVDLIDALAVVTKKSPSLHLLIIGEGNKEAEIREQVKHYNLDKFVTFLGWRKDVIKIIKSADIVTHPSLQEAFSSVMCEALWLGKPLIITDVSGATDIIINEQNGLIVPKENPEALGEAIERLANNFFLQNKLAKNGIKYAQSNLKIEKVIKKYEDSYLKAANII